MLELLTGKGAFLYLSADELRSELIRRRTSVNRRPGTKLRLLDALPIPCVCRSCRAGYVYLTNTPQRSH